MNQDTDDDLLDTFFTLMKQFNRMKPTPPEIVDEVTKQI